MANLIYANLKITMVEIKKLKMKWSNRPKTKPWIHIKHSGREGKEAWWKACDLGEPMQWTL